MDVPVGPIPRHPELDAWLAANGASPELLDVYADWWLERDVPLGAWIRDAARAEAGCDLSATGVVQRVAALPTGDQIALGLTRGLVTSALLDPALADRYDPPSSADLAALWAEPLLAVCADVRIALGQGEPDEPLARALAGRPPSLGGLAVVAPRFPDRPDAGAGTDLGLSGLAGPPVRRLCVRAADVRGLPPLGAVRRLELAAWHIDGDLRAPLPALELAHLWSGIPRDAAEAVLGSPRLAALGVHLDGALEAVASWPWERAVGLRELWLVGANVSASDEDVAALARRLPSGVVPRRMAPTEPLPDDFPSLV
jgi:hypothetical protein